MARGERLIKLGDSWFSAKSIEVERQVKRPTTKTVKAHCSKLRGKTALPCIYWCSLGSFGGRVRDKLEGLCWLIKFIPTPNTKN